MSIILSEEHHKQSINYKLIIFSCPKIFDKEYFTYLLYNWIPEQNKTYSEIIKLVA